MGWEALASVGFSALNANSQMKQGTAAANAAITQAGYQAKDVADNTVRAGGKLQTSFLQSGIVLDGGDAGSGPMAILSQAFAKGQTDIGRITANANQTAKNDINSARSKALAGLASGAVAGSSFLSTGLNNFGTDVGNGMTSAMNGTGFGFGYDVSQDFRNNGGGFAPGQFK